MKKILLNLFTIILAVSMVFTMAPLSINHAYAADPVTTTIDGVVYTLNEDDGTAAVTDFDHDNPPAQVTIPKKIGDNQQYTVTSIGDFAFVDCDSLTSITLPDSVKSIGDGVFTYCRALESVTLPDRLESIGWGAFRWCGLKSIIIPASVTSIGTETFLGLSGLTSAKFAEGSEITTIPASFLNGCSGLKSFEIPASVTSIERNAFNGCAGFTSIKLPEKVTRIPEYAFPNCTGLTTITIPAGVTIIEQGAFENVPLSTVNFLGSKAQWDAITGEGKPNIEGASDIIFKNEDGTELQFTWVKSGETPSYEGATPTKAADEQHEYAFAGWDPEITAVTGDATYTAKFVYAYTITFVDEDGTVLQSDKVAEGETPVYEGATPTKAADAQYTYKFKGWTPEITAVTGDATYTATYDKETNSISIKGAKVVLSATAFTYSGKAMKPSVKTIGGKALKAGTDYTAKWSNEASKNIGTYSVTVTGKGKYKDTAKATYQIVPKGTTLKKLKKAKKAVTVKWKKQNAKMPKARVTGYRIQLATDRAFKMNVKTVNVKGYKKASKKVNKLKAKTKYYVRICTYMKTGGKTYYSPWSKVKTVKTK